MLLFMLSTCLLHIFFYYIFINIGCATLYHLSMMYVTVYNMSFNSNCRILATELNYSGLPLVKALLDRDAFASRSPTQNQLVRCICVATI